MRREPVQRAEEGSTRLEQPESRLLKPGEQWTVDLSEEDGRTSFAEWYDQNVRIDSRLEWLVDCSRVRGKVEDRIVPDKMDFVSMRQWGTIRMGALAAFAVGTRKVHPVAVVFAFESSRKVF